MLEREQLIFFTILVVFIVATILWLYFTLRSIRLQKRIENHVVSNEHLDCISIADQIENWFHRILENLENKIQKMHIGQWVPFSKPEEEFKSQLTFFIEKILSSFSFLIIYLVFITLKGFSFSIWFFLIVWVAGWYLPNFGFYLKKRFLKKQIQSDLLKAISLMNHSFQSGKSMIQAIQLVAEELDGPLSQEFHKMHQDMLHGLSFETAFTRFQERIGLEEIQYITAALSIFSKTGGNIMTMFSSIEKSFYTRKRLDMELKATISSSQLVFYLLLLLPIFLWVLIGIVDPTYFSLFFESALGILLFCIILCIYFLYIIIIRNIMKIEKY